MSYLHRTARLTNRKILALSRERIKNILLFIIIAASLATFLIMLIIRGFTLDDFTSALTWAGIAALASSAGALLFWNFAIKTKRIKTSEFLFPWWLIFTLIGGAVALPFIGIYFGFLTIVPPSPPTPPVITGENATLKVQVPGDMADITGLCEAQLWRTDNQTNISSWVQINIQGSWGSTVFYHNGWLNAALFNVNLSKFLIPNQTTFFYVRVQAWWKLSEWQAGIYTPPSWWVPWYNYTSFMNETKPYIEENETCITLAPIGSGVNTILLISEPYTLYGIIQNAATLQPWNSVDGAYTDNYTATWQIKFKIPVNETYRGFNQIYDWQQQEYYGCWLIASSDDSQNIYNYYNDTFGISRVLWYNTTFGRDYKGAIFNNSLTSVATYDVALLLPTFNYDWSTQAQIQIANGSAGIHWFLGKGYESNIQIIREL